MNTYLIIMLATAGLHVSIERDPGGNTIECVALAATRAVRQVGDGVHLEADGTRQGSSSMGWYGADAPSSSSSGYLDSAWGTLRALLTNSTDVRVNAPAASSGSCLRSLNTIVRLSNINTSSTSRRGTLNGRAHLRSFPGAF